MGTTNKAAVIAVAALAAAAALGATREASAKTTWSLVHHEVNGDNAIISLDALDATHAFIVGIKNEGSGSKSFGKRTVDGVSWSDMFLPTGYMIAMFTTVSFASETRGWLGGITGKGARIWATADGGFSWAEAPGVTPGGVGQLQALASGKLFAPAHKQMVVFDGEAYQAVDVSVPAGLSLATVAMLNDDCGYAMAGPDTDQPAGAALFWSGDGGKSWEQRGGQLSYALTRMSWVSSSAGWAAGSQGGAGVIARTVDGGQSWTPVKVPDHPPVGAAGKPSPATDCTDVKFFDDKRGVAACVACTGGCGEGEKPSYISIFVRSDDGGANWAWDPDYEAVMVAPPFGAMAKFSGMFWLDFPDPNHGFIAGTNNLVLRYEADQQEAPGWGAPDCVSGSTPGTGGNPGSGGSAGSKAGAGADASDEGCGCRAGGRGAAGWWLVAAAALLCLAAARKRR
jgi:hypothetical protein